MASRREDLLQERVVSQLLRAQLPQIVASEALPRRVAALLLDKVPMLAASAVRASAIHDPDRASELTPELLSDALLVHTRFLTSQIVRARSGQTWDALRAELLGKFPCCSVRPGSYPFCNPDC